jgi:hypothetical protein
MMLPAMKTMTLLKVWIVLTLGWLFLLGQAMVEWYREEQLTGTTNWALRKSVWMIVLSLVSALVIHVLYRRGARRQSGEQVDGGLVLDVSPTRVLPGVAQGVAALGVTLLLGQLPRPACGGIVLGLLLAAAGGFLLRRETLRIMPGERILRSVHLLGHPRRTSELVLAVEKPIRLESLDERGVALLVGSVPLAEGLEHADALRIAETVGSALRREVKDNTGQIDERPFLVRAHQRLARLTGIALVLILVGLGVAWMVPAGRSALCRLAVAPHTPFSRDVRIPALRIAAVRYLASDPTDENLLTLLRVVNTADPAKSPEVLEAAVAELLALAGEKMDVAEGDAVGRINRWAARRLGRSLDAHDGVLGWYQVEEEKYRSALDTMAGDDLDAAAAAWDSFGAGDLTNPEDFLWAAGPGLADRRPIHFVLRRENRLEALPERREAYAGPVLAETVGEALALQLWSYEGVGGPEFPEGFWDWWAGHAQAHHLPPGGPVAR